MIRTCTLCGRKYQTMLTHIVAHCHKCFMAILEVNGNIILAILSELTDKHLKIIVALCHMLLANTQLEQSRRARMQTKLLKQTRSR